MQLLIITAQSAWSTLLICDRQARKDTAKVIRFSSTVAAVLTSKQAMQTYRMIWNAVVIAGMFAIACGSSVRELLDGYVESCIEQESDEPVPTVEEVAIALAVELVKDVREVGRAIATFLQKGWVAPPAPVLGQAVNVIVGAIALGAVSRQ